MIGELDYREAAAEDIAQLLPLLEQLFALEEDFVFNGELQAKGLSLLLESPSAIVVVAADGDRVVGMATGQVLISTAEGGPSLLVEDVSVADGYRCNGVGTRLLDFLGSRGAAFGACRMQLLADRNNKGGLAFYHKLGWEQTALICLRRYRKDGES